MCVWAGEVGVSNLQIAAMPASPISSPCNLPITISSWSRHYCLTTLHDLSMETWMAYGKVKRRRWGLETAWKRDGTSVALHYFGTYAGPEMFISREATQPCSATWRLEEVDKEAWRKWPPARPPCTWPNECTQEPARLPCLHSDRLGPGSS